MRESVTTLALGSWSRQRGCKGAGQEEAGSHITYSRECKKVWGSEPSHSQVNSHVGSWSPDRTPEFSERDRRGQNSSPRRVLYIIEKLLKCRCLKWARMAHLNIWNTSYGQKKGRESNWQFDSQPLKVGNRPDLLGCRQHATYRWKALDESYNFASEWTSIRGLLAMLWGSKVAGVPVGGISGLPCGSPETKSHLDVASVERHRVYYKGEGGGFPKSGPWWVKWVQGCPWLVLAPKVLQLCTNHFVRVLCKPVWVSEACQLFLVPSRSSNPPLYSSKGCELGSASRLLSLPLSFTWIHIWVLQGVGGASINHIVLKCEIEFIHYLFIYCFTI